MSSAYKMPVLAPKIYDYGTTLRVKPELGNNPFCLISGGFRIDKTDKSTKRWAGTEFTDWFTEEPLELNSETWDEIVYVGAEPCFDLSLCWLPQFSTGIARSEILIHSFLEPDPICVQKTLDIKATCKIGDLVKPITHMVGLNNEERQPLKRLYFSTLILVEKEKDGALCFGVSLNAKEKFCLIPWTRLWKHYE